MPVFGAEPVTVPSGPQPALAALVFGAEPVTVPSWLGWPATSRLREYGTADTPGAGNVTGQCPDFARARRSRATFCAAWVSCVPALASFAAFCSELFCLQRCEGTASPEEKRYLTEAQRTRRVFLLEPGRPRFPAAVRTPADTSQAECATASRSGR
jgi:hypothetical protein